MTRNLGLPEDGTNRKCSQDFDFSSTILNLEFRRLFPVKTDDGIYPLV